MDENNRFSEVVRAEESRKVRQTVDQMNTAFARNKQQAIDVQKRRVEDIYKQKQLIINDINNHREAYTDTVNLLDVTLFPFKSRGENSQSAG